VASATSTLLVPAPAERSRATGHVGGAWLRRHGHIDERAAEERSNETIEPSAIEACAQLALAGGAFLARPYEPKVEPNADLDHKEPRFSARIDGFDVHCAVRIAANDDVRRERLVRYCARPPLSLDRIEVQRDGRIAFRLKQPRKGRTHRVMDPLSFMARLAAQIPHPKRLTERAVVSKILDHLQVRSTPLPRAKARDPTWVQESFEYEHAVA
jgi:Putative transposase